MLGSGDGTVLVKNYRKSRISLLPEETETVCVVSGGEKMPEEEVVERAQRDKEQGKSPSTKAGAYVGEEIQHSSEGRRGGPRPSESLRRRLYTERPRGVDAV